MPEIKKTVIWDSTQETENEVNVRNKTGTPVNPATEEKQDSIISGLGDVSANVNTVGDSLFAGRKRVTTPGTQVPIGTTTVLSQGVVVSALDTNVGNVFVGNSSVNRGADATKQIELLPGQGIGVSINDLAKVYVDADNANDGISYLAT